MNWSVTGWLNGVVRYKTQQYNLSLVNGHLHQKDSFPCFVLLPHFKIKTVAGGKIIYLVLCLIVWNCLFWTLLKEAAVASATCDRNNMIQIVMMDIKSKRFEWTRCKKPLLLVNGFAYEKQTLAQPNLHLEVQHCYSCDKEHLKSLSQEETGQN